MPVASWWKSQELRLHVYGTAVIMISAVKEAEN
jgi:hypothetical protein